MYSAEFVESVPPPSPRNFDSAHCRYRSMWRAETFVPVAGPLMPTRLPDALSNSQSLRKYQHASPFLWQPACTRRLQSCRPCRDVPADGTIAAGALWRLAS
jgi:hypothetical protein